MSVNGPIYNSVIVLLTSDKIDGTYVYQGPVVFGGFLSGSNADISWKKTDLELVIGEQTSLPARYNQGASNWPKYWTNVIDPCVFYDNDGQLWMSYGSWFGGIWMLQLDEETGLRDYDVTYESNYSEKGQGVTSDPYFGKKIAGCYQVSAPFPRPATGGHCGKDRSSENILLDQIQRSAYRDSCNPYAL